MTQLRALHKKAIMSDLINIGMPEMREEGQLDTEAYHVIWTLNIQYLSVRAQVYALNWKV